MVRNAAETGLLIAKRRHQLNPSGGERQPGEPRMRQKDLAALLGVAPSTVANWERGKSYPGRYLGSVEQALRVNLTSEPEPGGGPDFDPGDPDEARIASWAEMGVARRQAMIYELRDARRAARSKTA